MDTIFNYLKLFNTFIQKILEFIVGVSMVSMVVLIFLQVIFRYVLEAPLSWAEELAQYIFSWLIFAGAAVAFRENKHINVEIIIDSIKDKKVKKYCLAMIYLCVLFFLSLIMMYAFPIAMQLIQLNKVAVSMTFLQTGYVYLIIPVASAISILMILENLVGLFLQKDGE